MFLRAGEKKFQLKCTRAPTVRKLLCFMLLPHNGKAFGAMREMYGMLHEKKKFSSEQKGRSEI